MSKYILFLLFNSCLLIPLCLADETPAGLKCNDEERRALLTFKQHLIDSSGRLASWSGSNCCQWNGLSCDNHTGHIVKLDLRSPYPYIVYDDNWDLKDYQQTSLSGKINPSLLSLKQLDYLDLSWNDFKGIRIPNFLGKLTSLRYLNLSYSAFSGEIPHFLGNLSNLNHLVLRKLQSLDLSGNNFYGPVPESIRNLSSLKELYLGQNSLNGSIPEALGQLSQLVQLDLSDNLWEGSLTESHLINLTKLEYFAVGTLRPTHLIFNVTYVLIPSFKLRKLYIKNCPLDDAFFVWLQSQTELSDVNLIGTGISGIPQDWLLRISSQLENLDLSNNQIQGELPFRSMFPLLRIVDLSRNLFSSSIPSNVGKLMPNLEILHLSDNHLEGTIPPSICEMKHMSLLSLRNNQLSGEFPRAWSLWRHISVLDVSSNNISGHIPNNIPSGLVILKMSNNHFGGKIPSSLQHCTQLSRVDLGGNNLSGNLPSWIGSMVGLVIVQLRSSGHIPRHLCNLVNLHILELAHNNFSGTIPNCLEKLNSEDSCVWAAYGSYDDETKVISKGMELEYGINNVQLVKSIDLSSNNLEGEIPEEIHYLKLVKEQFTREDSDKHRKVGFVETLRTISDILMIIGKLP